MHRVHIRIGGRVQGVGFRYFVLRAAERLAVRGWVANRADGTVEIEAEGSHRCLTEFVSELHRGPRGSRVESVIDRWSEAAAQFEGFTVRR